LTQFGREAIIWRQLSHPNVLPFFGVYTLEGRLCLVSPWIENGHLQQFLRNTSFDVSRASLMLDVTMGLEYLHGKYVVHGDLKATNILVTPSGRACIADFGLSTIVDKMSLQFTHSTSSVRGGTARYQAPELLSGESLNHFGSDIYAFACVCYEIFTGKVPFFELANEIAVGIKVIGGYRPLKPEIIPDKVWTLLEACWAQSHSNRPSMTQIRQRIVGPSMPGLSPPFMADWDETCSARFRRSVQKWPPLLPSVNAIQRYLGEPNIEAWGRLSFLAGPFDVSTQGQRRKSKSWGNDMVQTRW